MYQDKMAFAIKVDGKILREVGETVHIPFGSEYSILIKNLNSVKAKVTVEIDGASVTDGVELIINPNQSMDLERFIKNGNMLAGNKLKFIEKTDIISNHRGDKIDDGLVRITFEFEKPFKYTPSPFIDLNDLNQRFGGNRYNQPTELYGSYNGGLMRGMGETLINSVHPATASGAVANEAGITVEGAVSNQQFTYAPSFTTDGVKHSMVIALKGKLNDEPVETPILVSTKPICKTCGKKNKSTDKFCSQCGTSLQII